MGTRYTSPVIWPSPYACTQLYHPGRYQTAMDSCFGLVRPRLFGIADNYRSRVLQIRIKNVVIVVGKRTAFFRWNF